MIEEYFSLLDNYCDENSVFPSGTTYSDFLSSDFPLLVGKTLVATCEGEQSFYTCK